MGRPIEAPDADIPPLELTPVTRRQIRECLESLAALPGLKRHGPTIQAKLEHLARAAYSAGVGYAIESEAKAWARTTDLEDVIIELVRYAPGSTMMKAKALAAEVEAPFKDAEAIHG